MTTLLHNIDGWIVRCLEQAGVVTRRLGNGRWVFQPPGDPRLRGNLRRRGEWLMFDVPVSVRGRRLNVGAVGRLLEAQRHLPAGVKVGLGGNRPRLWIGGEMLLDLDDSEHPLSVEAVLTGLADALGRVTNVLKGTHAESLSGKGDRHPSSSDRALPEPRQTGASPLFRTDSQTAPIDDREQADAPAGTAADPSTNDDDIKPLCHEAGWPCTERSSGRIVVPLDVPGAFHQAQVQRSGERLRLSVALDIEAAGDVSRQAAGVLLLTACRAVRMARAVAADEAGTPTFGWEVVFDARPTPRELDAAFSALSVACRLTAREVQLLGDERLAKEYLTVRGWSP